VPFSLVPKAAKNRETNIVQNANNTLYKQLIVDIMSNRYLSVPYHCRQYSLLSTHISHYKLKCQVQLEGDTAPTTGLKETTVNLTVSSILKLNE
jgi:adenine-specific DNA methylase